MIAAPLITVYMATRNRSALVGRAIASVLAQTHRHIEMIVVDDASDDDTVEIVKAFALRDPRVTLLCRPLRGGAPAARNDAIREARGEFITGIDDDDLFLPTRVESLWAAYRDCYAFVFSGMFWDTGKWLKVIKPAPQLITLDQQLHSNQIGNQVLTLTERFREVGGFDERFVACQDYDLWTRLMQRYGDAYCIGEPTYVMRADPEVDRIMTSGRLEEGLRQFALKFSPFLSPAHRSSQRFMELRASNKRLTLHDVRMLWPWPNRKALLVHFAKSNLRFLNVLVDFVRMISSNVTGRRRRLDLALDRGLGKPVERL